MRSSAFFGGLAILASAAAAALTACDPSSTGECACPPGTEYQTATTYAILGVNAKDFRERTADFFNTDWVNTRLTSTSGPNNTPGSLRSFNIITDVGTYPFTEILIEYDTKPDGSFIQRLAQFNLPIEYASRNGSSSGSSSGSLSGFWVSLESNYAAQYETVIRWRVYACFTGHPLNFAEFCTAALTNLTSVFESQGLLRGETVGPYAVQSF